MWGDWSGRHIGHREGFAAARDTQQYLMRKVLFKPADNCAIALG